MMTLFLLLLDAWFITPRAGKVAILLDFSASSPAEACHKSEEVFFGLLGHLTRRQPFWTIHIFRAGEPGENPELLGKLPGAPSDLTHRIEAMASSRKWQKFLKDTLFPRRSNAAFAIWKDLRERPCPNCSGLLTAASWLARRYDRVILLSDGLDETGVKVRARRVRGMVEIWGDPPRRVSPEKIETLWKEAFGNRVRFFWNCVGR